jgi:hypothetical protein
MHSKSGSVQPDVTSRGVNLSIVAPDCTGRWSLRKERCIVLLLLKARKMKSSKGTLYCIIAPESTEDEVFERNAVLYCCLWKHGRWSLRKERDFVLLLLKAQKMKSSKGTRFCIVTPERTERWSLRKERGFVLLPLKAWKMKSLKGTRFYIVAHESMEDEVFERNAVLYCCSRKHGRWSLRKERGFVLLPLKARKDEVFERNTVLTVNCKAIFDCWQTCGRGKGKIIILIN